jgi:hypothetical protein
MEQADYVEREQLGVTARATIEGAPYVIAVTVVELI